MLRWMGPKGKGHRGKDRITDDPLAAIDPGRKDQGIYSVSRSVRLPRIKLRQGDGGFGSLADARETDKLRVNPIFVDGYHAKSKQHHHQTSSRSSTQSAHFGYKSSSSGYGTSHNDPIFAEPLHLKEDAVSVVSQNPNYVKSIKVAARSSKSQTSASTLSTIPEDLQVPRPIWPRKDYDSLVDEAMLLYTSLSYKPENAATVTSEVSIKEVLVELLGNVTATIEGKGVLSPEETLKKVNEKIALSLDALKNVTEEEMRLLCVNLRNSQKVSSVLRALSSSSSGNSSQGSPEWSSRTLSSDAEDVYQVPSASSSSGYSEVKTFEHLQLPMFVHEDLANVPNGMRNAMIYGTLCRTGFKNMGERLLEKEEKVQVTTTKKSLLKTEDQRPSVWEQYYGVNLGGEVTSERRNYVPKPTDVPIFPGGRPEADFTLDLPRSELLTKRMKQDKKWRCRCRILTTFLGLVFFLLSVMAVSLMLTRGKRMFGSMV